MKKNKIGIFLFLCGWLLLSAERLQAETNWIKSFQQITNAGISEYVMLDGALPELVKMYPPVTNVVFNCQGGSDVLSPGDGEGFSLSRAKRWGPNPEAMEIFFRLSPDAEQMEIELEYLDHALNARSFSIYLDGLTVATVNTPFSHLADPALGPVRTDELRTVKVRIEFLPQVKDITHHSLRIISTDQNFGSIIIDSISLRGRGVEILHPETLAPLNSEQLAAEARRKAGITEDDVKRGYFAYFPSVYRPRIPIRTIDVDMGVNEHEFIELGIFFYKPIGGTEIKLINNNYPGNIQVAVEEEKKIRSKTNLAPVVGQRNPIWLIMDSKGVPSGNYKCRLTVSPEKAVPYEIALNITVWPIELSVKRKFLCSFFHSGIASVFSWLYPKRPVEQWPGLWEQSMADLQMAGQNIMEFYPNKPIAKIITVTRFEKDYLPILEFSAWDPYLDAALKHGMEHVMVRYGWIREEWLPPDYKQFSDIKKREVDLFLIRQIYGHFKEKGFKRVFYYYIDEPKPGEFEKNYERIQPVRDVLPGLEFAGSGFNIRMSLEEKQRYCDHLTWLAPYYGHGQKFFDAMKSGELKLLPDTIIATQFAAVQSANVAHSSEYWSGRLSYWQAWKRGLSGCQIYTYGSLMKGAGGMTYNSVFSEDNKRILTPIFFGFIDGNEDIAYLTMLNNYLEELKNKKKTEVLKLLENKLETMVGPDNSILRWGRHPAYRFDYQGMSGDDQAMREAKREVLRILSKRRWYESKWHELLMRWRNLF